MNWISCFVSYFSCLIFTLHGTNIFHMGKRTSSSNIFKKKEMLVPGRVVICLFVWTVVDDLAFNAFQPHTHKHIHIVVPAEWSTGTFKKQLFPKAGLCMKTCKCCVFAFPCWWLVTWCLMVVIKGWCLCLKVLNPQVLEHHHLVPKHVFFFKHQKHWKSWISNMK